ncbi:MAG: hypothetical protein PHQ43_00095 [Dehalococcoidales bacterium]|nr:hypothetical protein [Dehalococcoidales bacterium]
MARAPKDPETGHMALTAARAEGYFHVYYQMGPERSIEKLQNLLAEVGRKVSLNTLKRHSADFHWQKRVLDIEAQKNHDEQILKTVREMNEHHAKLGRAMTTLGQASIQSYFNEIKAKGSLKLSTYETANLIATGQKVERLARGQATERTEIYVEMVNTLVMKLAGVFIAVNEIADPEERKRQYAQQCDDILGEYQQAPKQLTEGKQD